MGRRAGANHRPHDLGLGNGVMTFTDLVGKAGGRNGGCCPGGSPPACWRSPLRAKQVTGKVSWDAAGFVLAAALVVGRLAVFELVVWRLRALALRRIVGLGIAATVAPIWSEAAEGVSPSPGRLRGRRRRPLALARWRPGQLLRRCQRRRAGPDPGGRGAVELRMLHPRRCGRSPYGLAKTHQDFGAPGEIAVMGSEGVWLAILGGPPSMSSAPAWSGAARA